jgi:hypothetical protein
VLTGLSILLGYDPHPRVTVDAPAGCVYVHWRPALVPSFAHLGDLLRAGWDWDRDADAWYWQAPRPPTAPVAWYVPAPAGALPC